MNIELNDNEVLDTFDDLKIIQNKELPKYQIDAFLLSEFVDEDLKKNSKIVDLGTGTGIVGLLYSKKSRGQITLVEIQEQLAQIAQRNIEINNLEQRINVLNADMKQLIEHISISSVDTVLSNPPYFDNAAHHQQSPSDSFAIARHEIAIDLDGFIDTAKKILKNKGKLFFIHRSSRIGKIFSVLQKNRFGVEKIQFIHHDANKNSDLVLIKAIKDGSMADIKVVGPKFIEKNNYDQRR